MEGSRLGKYEIRALIGRGAMGAVYEGWDPVIGRRVAIKTLKLRDPWPQEPEHRARFRREAQAAGRLDHQNVVRVYDYGETGEFAYIVLQYIDGTPLSARLPPGCVLPWAEAGHVMEGLLAALGHSHGQGVVHRDIKPANILLTRDGQVKVTDFGVAHLENTNMTQVGVVIGTPAYMAPEQVTGARVDQRTDLYAAGVVLYQMLTGRRPFEGSTASVMNHVVHTPPPRPSQVSAAAIPAGLEAVILKALAKRPDQRFGSAGEFARALRAELKGVGDAATDARWTGPATDGATVPSSGDSRPSRFTTGDAPRSRTRWRKPAWLAAGAGVVALAVLATWLLPLPSGWLRRPPAPGGVEAFDRTMRDWIAAHQVPAASLAVTRNNRLVLARGYGARAAADRVPVWGLSKAITAVCVAELVDEGRLGFGDRTGPLLASFFQRYGPPADDRLATVTVGQLLSHRSGLPGHGPWGGFAPRVHSLLQLARPDELRANMVTPAILGLRLEAAPGERYEISDLNYLLLGEIIETKAGKPYTDACRERVLDRAGIDNANLAPRWGALTWAANGWALSGPEYLAFARLLRPQKPDPLGESGRAWLDDPEGKWTDATHARAYTLGVFLRPLDGSAVIWHWGSWSWHQEDAAGGPINVRAGALFFARPDGTAVFASFDGVAPDRDGPAAQDLDRALHQDADAVTTWPEGDLFATMGISPVRAGGRAP
ncbi:MAG: serine hydrolase [Acetobacteraceae bacterium]|nr:serine hydrolase [Acetobacteraceae bacterium]